MLSAHAVVIDPALLGQPLAQPWRRGLALAVDIALLLMPSVVAACAAAALSLAITEPLAWQALHKLVVDHPAPAEVDALMVDVAPLLVKVNAPGLPIDLAAAIAHHDRDRVEAMLATADLLIVLRFDDGEPPPGKIVVPLDRLIPVYVRSAAMLGVPALYFTLFHAGRRGATPGKRLLGLRVARLDGERLGLLGSLERFGGYFGIAGTVGIGLVELWRDPLRQLGHDKGAGTVVIRTPRGRSARTRSRSAP